MGIQELLARRLRPAPKQEINVVGVLVYCDPKTWPEDPERLNPLEGWFIAVGVHPKHALDFGDYYYCWIPRLRPPWGRWGLIVVKEQSPLEYNLVL